MLEDKILAAEVLKADEERLTGLANKGLYKRAVKDTEGEFKIEWHETPMGLDVLANGEKCLIKAPLEASICSCPARGICRHILASIIFLRSAFIRMGYAEETEEPSAPEPEQEVQTEPTPEPEAAPEPGQAESHKPLTKKELAKVHEAADICKTQLAGILKRGLVRAADSACDGLEIAAVRCHAAKMADAEKAVREVGSRLGDCLERRAAFDERVFTHRLCESFRLLSRLESDTLTEKELGSFKRSYEEYGGSLDILPIGIRQVTEGDYQGEIYYFLNMDEKAEQRFFTYSELRPVFYENTKNMRRGSSEVWGAGMTIKSLMRSRMTLIGAKVSDGKLSSSSTTTIVSQQRANLNCASLRRLVCDDLREIAVTLGSRQIKDETHRLFFFHPKRILGCEFDDITQQLVIELADSFGNAARMTAKHTKFTKEFITQVESHVRKMQNHPEVYYVWLVSAYFEDNELTLFPIEMYDFISELEKHDFKLPAEYEKTDVQAGYANKLGVLFDETENKLCEAVRSGIGAGLTGTEQITKRAADYGLAELSRLCGEFFKTAERYRHSFDDLSLQALGEMSAVYDYISLARKKLSLVSALYNMKL